MAPLTDLRRQALVAGLLLVLRARRAKGSTKAPGGDSSRQLVCPLGNVAQQQLKSDERTEVSLVEISDCRLGASERQQQRVSGFLFVDR